MSRTLLLLEFPAEIVDLEVGSAEYVPKAKGKYLFLKARHKKVAPTSLLVRYGEEKQGYIAELIPDEQTAYAFPYWRHQEEPCRAPEKQQKVVFGQDQDYC